MKNSILITYDKEDAISEAIALCDSAGYRVSYIIKQKYLMFNKVALCLTITIQMDRMYVSFWLISF